ncbi:nucleoporin GLE1 [Pelobates cultripes]|uniref:mRNA export factor GLE1 n=3 Tax=Pelobates cultripes TaxID=61616 RepID=A0AAD1WNZ6_PELCU|nr:nucleoporin GLE1 [Pelobates cultripes]
MPFGRDWETLHALRDTPKGKLVYGTEENLLEELQLSEASWILPSYCAQVLDNVLQHTELDTAPISGLSFHNVDLSSQMSSPSTADPPVLTSSAPSESRSEETFHDDKESTEVQDESSFNSWSTTAMEVESSLRMYENSRTLKVKDELRKRQEFMEMMSKSFAEKAAEQFKRYEEKMELKRRQEIHQLQEQMEKDHKEAMEKEEKLKEEHRHRATLLSLKLREVEQQRQQELERVRQEEGRDRTRRLCSLQQEALQLIQQIEVDYKQQESLRLDLSAYSHRGNQICGILSNIVRSSSERGYPTQDDVSMGESSVQEMKALVSNMQRDMAAAEERRKAEEAAAREKQKESEVQQQAKSQPQDVSKQTQDRGQTRKEGLQENAAKSTVQRYRQLQSICDQSLKSFSELSTCKDSKTKSLKAELQKAVTIPVSQISTISGSQLREIFDKINNVLLGKQITSGRQAVSVSQHPQALEFVYYKLAEKFVKQGEEEVASHFEAAFPIAAVASGIWELHPRVGDLLLAHLHKKCPYSVPFYPAYKEGTPFEDYQRLLGYKVDDSMVEQQDNFLKRMSGMIRLYAAIIQLRWPYGTKQASPHPHGLNHGWSWLAQLLNMEPLVDVTATLLYDFLEVCGNALSKQYQAQFWKLLLLLKDEYFPRIEMITSAGQMGSVTRLRQFLETALLRKEIPLPKGYLSSSFWRT